MRDEGGAKCSGRFFAEIDGEVCVRLQVSAGEGHVPLTCAQLPVSTREGLVLGTSAYVSKSQ